jgi:hypothetical protein
MRTAFSCVVDDDPKYIRQAVLWAASLLVYGEQRAESLVVHTVGQADPGLRHLLDHWGIEMVEVQAFDGRHRYSNKLTQFETASLREADVVVLCDCDLAFTRSVMPWIQGERLRARIAHRPWLRPAQWDAIFASANLRLPTARVRAGNGEWTLPSFCNGGLYMMPRALFDEMGDVWVKWNRWLLERLELLHPLQMFADQVSFSLACEDLGLRIDYLPVELNYHLGFSPTASPDGDDWWIDVPRVLHYHKRMGPDGYLQGGQIQPVTAAVVQINGLIRCLRDLYPLEQPS